MCFAIPKKIENVTKDTITTTDGVIAKNGGLTLEKGDYALIYGDVVVEKIPKSQAIKALQDIVKSTN